MLCEVTLTLCTQSHEESIGLHDESGAYRFNSTVFANCLPADLEIAWSAHLKTTAGTTHFRREPPGLLFAGPRYTQPLHDVVPQQRLGLLVLSTSGKTNNTYPWATDLQGFCDEPFVLSINYDL